MRVSEEDYRERLNRAQRDGVVANASVLRQVAQGELMAAQLTGSPDWDAYLRIVRGMRDDAERELSALRAQVEDIGLGSDNLRAVQARIHAVRERLNTLDAVSDIPKVLLERGAKARELLAKYADTEEN